MTHHTDKNSRHDLDCDDGFCGEAHPSHTDADCASSSQGESSVQRLPRPLPIYPQLREAQQSFYERKRILAAHYGSYYSGGLPTSETPSGFLDTDGTWCDAVELMGIDKASHGRKRAWGFNRSGGPSVRWSDLAPECIDHLATDGWHIDEAGTTGQRKGRPTKGITDKGAILRELVKQAQDGRFQTLGEMTMAEKGDRATWRDARDALCVLLALAPKLNVAATAKATGLSRKTIYEYRKRGKMLLEQLDRIEAEVMRIGQFFPTPVQEAEQALAEEPEPDREDENQER